MKKCFPALSLFMGVALMILCASASGDLGAGPGRPPSEPLKLDPDFGALPLYFIPNRGQTDAEALFFARTPGTTLWITKSGLVFDSVKPTSQDGAQPRPGMRGAAPDVKRYVSSLLFVGANSNPEVRASEPSAHRVNYLAGVDPSSWRTDIPTSMAVVYENVYRNIDLKVYGREGRIEYDWLVRPGGEPREIRFRYMGVEGAEIEPDGDILIRTGAGEIRHAAPTSFQAIGGRRVPVEAAFRKIGENEYGFSMKGYDPGYELVIDPVVLIYSTYLGGTDSDSGSAIALGADNSAYIVGTTYSGNFPIKKPFQAAPGGSQDIFVSKIAPNGKSLVYSTYLGGKGREWGNGIAVDGTGAAYVTGDTESSDFPMKNAFQEALAGPSDLFVAKLSSAGNALVFSTYLGGSDFDSCNGISVDGAGAVYITGTTNSPDFPTKNAYRKTRPGGYNAFVAKLAPKGASLVYSTYLGGSANDWGGGIAVDSAGAAYVSGQTLSTDFPVKNAYQAKLRGKSDIFVAKLSASGKSLLYSTYLGGSGGESNYGIAVDGGKAAYVAGYTSSSDYPLQHPLQSVLNGDYDACVTKLAASGKSLVYSTYLGGSSHDFAYAIAVDNSGQAVITGRTSSTNFPLRYAYQEVKRGKYDAFVAKIESGGDSLAWSTYLGGSADDYGRGVAVDADGLVYVTGITLSKNFSATPGAYQKIKAGSSDAFVTKLSLRRTQPSSKKRGTD
jgi:hypothetical protein